MCHHHSVLALFFRHLPKVGGVEKFYFGASTHSFKRKVRWSLKIRGLGWLVLHICSLLQLETRMYRSEFYSQIQGSKMTFCVPLPMKIGMGLFTFSLVSNLILLLSCHGLLPALMKIDFRNLGLILSPHN